MQNKIKRQNLMKVMVIILQQNQNRQFQEFCQNLYFESETFYSKNTRIILLQSWDQYKQLSKQQNTQYYILVSQQLLQPLVGKHDLTQNFVIFGTNQNGSRKQLLDLPNVVYYTSNLQDLRRKLQKRGFIPKKIIEHKLRSRDLIRIKLKPSNIPVQQVYTERSTNIQEIPPIIFRQNYGDINLLLNKQINLPNNNEQQNIFKIKQNFQPKHQECKPAKLPYHNNYQQYNSRLIGQGANRIIDLSQYDTYIQNNVQVYRKKTPEKVYLRTCQPSMRQIRLQKQVRACESKGSENKLANINELKGQNQSILSRFSIKPQFYQNYLSTQDNIEHFTNQNANQNQQKQENSPFFKNASKNHSVNLKQTPDFQFLSKNHLQNRFSQRIQLSTVKDQLKQFPNQRPLRYLDEMMSQKPAQQVKLHISQNYILENPTIQEINQFLASLPNKSEKHSNKSERQSSRFLNQNIIVNSDRNGKIDRLKIKINNNNVNQEYFQTDRMNSKLCVQNNKMNTPSISTSLSGHKLGPFQRSIEKTLPKGQEPPQKYRRSSSNQHRKFRLSISNNSKKRLSSNFQKIKGNQLFSDVNNHPNIIQDNSKKQQLEKSLVNNYYLKNEEVYQQPEKLSRKTSATTTNTLQKGKSLSVKKLIKIPSRNSLNKMNPRQSDYNQKRKHDNDISIVYLVDSIFPEDILNVIKSITCINDSIFKFKSLDQLRNQIIQANQIYDFALVLSDEVNLYENLYQVIEQHPFCYFIYLRPNFDDTYAFKSNKLYLKDLKYLDEAFAQILEKKQLKQKELKQPSNLSQFQRSNIKDQRANLQYHFDVNNKNVQKQKTIAKRISLQPVKIQHKYSEPISQNSLTNIQGRMTTSDQYLFNKVYHNHRV